MRELREIHRRCFRLLAAGIPQVEIARQLGVVQSTICDWKRQPIFWSNYTIYREMIEKVEDERIKQMFGVVVDTLQSVLLNGSNFEKLRACELVLRVLGKDVRRLQVEDKRDPSQMSNEEIQREIEAANIRIRTKLDAMKQIIGDGQEIIDPPEKYMINSVKSYQGL